MRRLIAIGLVLSLSSLLLAEDWPGWRGPRGDGTSLAAGVPLDFSPTKNVAWKVAVPGKGHSSPVVVGDRILLTTCLEDSGERVLLCLDRKLGREQWRQTVVKAKLERKHGENSYASSTPASDGKHVWVAFLDYPTMQVACYDLDGKKVWQKSPGKLLSVHGFCSSPVLHKGLVIVNGDQDAPAFIVALDQATGEERWRADRPNKTRSYCVPILIPDPKVAGRTQLVLSGSKSVTGYDADTGKLIWNIDGPTEQYVASLVPHKGLLFLTTGFPQHHLMGIRPDGEGNITKTKHIAWHIPHKDNGAKGAAYVPSPLAHDGLFFVVSDPGFLGCIEAETGNRLWMKKLGRKHHASPVLVQGHMIIPDDDGGVHVVKAGREFDLVRKVDMKEPIFASPAVAGNELFLRTEKHLYCIAAGNSAAAR